MPIRDQEWRRVVAGDRIETARHEPVAKVIIVEEEAVLARDPAEGRLLRIPRDAFAARRPGRLRLRRAPVHARGEGPERYVARPTLAEDWVPSHTERGVTIEAEDELHARRVDADGTAEEEDPGEARDHAPQELP